MQALVSPSTRPGLARAHLAASGLLVLLVLVQAVLAGQHLFDGADIEVHGFVGNGSFTVGLIAAGLAAAGRLPRAVLLLSGASLLALFVQTGLGYMGREMTDAAAWHIPLGVTTFGLVALQAGASAVAVLRGAPDPAV